MLLGLVSNKVLYSFYRRLKLFFTNSSIHNKTYVDVLFLRKLDTCVHVYVHNFGAGTKPRTLIGLNLLYKKKVLTFITGIIVLN